jgi:hypothetical protein
MHDNTYRVALRATMCALLLDASSVARADDEAPNVPYVRADAYGRCYAKLVPLKLYDSSAGTTRVFAVGKDKDTLLHTYSWFSKEIYLQCNLVDAKGRSGLSLVRMGAWPGGSKASAATLCLAFYFGGKLLKQYSTLDIAGSVDNVSRSVSHYQIVKKVLGYRWRSSSSYAFEIVTVDGRTLAFDPATGERLAGQPKTPAKTPPSR